MRARRIGIIVTAVVGCIGGVITAVVGRIGIIVTTVVGVIGIIVTAVVRDFGGRCFGRRCFFLFVVGGRLFGLRTACKSAR